MAAGLEMAMEAHKNRRQAERRKSNAVQMRTAQVSDLCRRRLLNYADTFYELAKSYDGEFYSNETSQEDRQSLLAERRLWENRQIIRGHLNEMARIMKSVACEVMCYRPMEDRKTRLLIQAMREEGILVEGPCYAPKEDGREAVVLTMRTEKRNGMSAEEAADMISVLFNKRFQLSLSSPYLIEQEPHSFVLEEEAEYLALTGFSRVTKENESVSGDNYTVIETQKGRVTVMLSDGTGSGEQAGEDSGQVLDLMEKLLEVGYGSEAAVNMVNASLFALGDDNNHPTLDICDIDLYQGCCQLWKVGGAVTLLKREDEVEPLTMGTLPLGVFQAVELTPIHRQLQDGDFLVMVTDGVVDAFGAEEFEDGIRRAVAGIRGQNPSEIAEKLLRRAICACGGRIRDDMTVGVIGIWKS